MAHGLATSPRWKAGRMNICCACSFHSVLETGDTAMRKSVPTLPLGGELGRLTCFHALWVAAALSSTCSFMFSLWTCPSDPVRWCGCLLSCLTLLLRTYGLWPSYGSPVCGLRALSSSFLPCLPALTCRDPVDRPTAPATISKSGERSLFQASAPCSLYVPPVQVRQGRCYVFTKSCFIFLLLGTQTTIHNLRYS